MTEKSGQGQADKAAAEKKTADVAAENKATADAQRTDSRQPPVADSDVAAPVDNTPERADGGPARPVGLDPSIAPYPQYEDERVEDLRSLAEGRGVEINRDVEKALLIKGLRDRDRESFDVGPDRDDARSDAAAEPSNAYPSYDFMPLEELRSLAKDRDVALKPVDEKAHLVGELRANDSGANTSSTTPGTTV